MDEKEALARALALPSSSSESEEEEEEVKPESRGFLDAAIDLGLVVPKAGMVIAQWDQFRRVNEIHALGNRRSALEKNNKESQAKLLKSQENFIHALLIDIKPQLQPEVPLTLPAFMDLFKQIAIEQMRKVENARLTSISKDLYIMAGMMAGLFRADEEYRCAALHNQDNQVLNFEMRNFHAEAETFLINEKLQETDRRQAEKRKIADEEEDLRKMIEAEERRREEEEMDEAIRLEIDAILELKLFDTYHYHLLLANGWTDEEATAVCQKEARERRIASQTEVEIRSSPPRSEVDPDDVAVDLEAIALEDEYSVYTPRPCPSAQIRAVDLFAAAAEVQAAGGGFPAFANYQQQPDDVEMYDASERGGGEYVIPDQSLQRRERDYREESIEPFRSPTYGEEDNEEEQREEDNTYLLRSPTYGEDENEEEEQRQTDHRDTQQRQRGDRVSRHAACEAREEQRLVDHRETQQRQSRGDHVSRHGACAAREEVDLLADHRETQQGQSRGDYVSHHAAYAAREEPRTVDRWETQQRQSRGDHVSHHAAYEAREEPRMVDHRETQQRQSRGDHVSRHAAYAAREEQQQQRMGEFGDAAPRVDYTTIAAAAAAARRQQTREEEERRKRRERQAAMNREEAAALRRSSRSPARATSNGREKEKRRGRSQEGEEQDVMSAVARQLQLEQQKQQRQQGKGRTSVEESTRTLRSRSGSRTGSREASPVQRSPNKVKRREEREEQVVVPAAATKQLQQQQMRPQAPPPLHAPPPAPAHPLRTRSKSRSPMGSREASPAPFPVYDVEPECVEMEEVAAVEQRAAFPHALLQLYKQPLTSGEMEKMREARMKREKMERKGTLTDVEAISSGQTKYWNYVWDPVLGLCRLPVVEERPKIRVDYGVRPKDLKSILKVKNACVPALLTDLHAHRLKGDDVVSKRERNNLLRMQRYNALYPEKKVTFRDADDPLHQIRCYEMQAEQVRTRKLCDATDDGYDKYQLTKHIGWLHDLHEAVALKFDKDLPGGYMQHASVKNRIAAGDTHVQGQSRKQRMRDPYLTGPATLPLTKRQDVIFTRASARIKPTEKAEDFREFTVSHRDYKIIRAIKPMTDVYLQKKWLPELRLYARDAFGCELNRKELGKSVGNAGLTHLVFTDSLLDRVNTYRFPQSYFIIHQHPLTLSSSFRVLCNEIPLEKLVNIEWFIFAYGFDEVVFEGEDPQIAAQRVMNHMQATMELYCDAVKILSETHRCTRQAQFRVFSLPTYGMDKAIVGWINEFNGHLKWRERIMHRLLAVDKLEWLAPCMFAVVDWETPAIVEDTKILGHGEVKKLRTGSTFWEKLPNYRYNCIDSFARSAQQNCQMRTARALSKNYIGEYHHKRITARVHGLSEEEHNRYY